MAFRAPQILVGGTEADTRGMKELLERGAEHPPEILTPRVKQVVDVSSTSNILQVCAPPPRGKVQHDEEAAHEPLHRGTRVYSLCR